MGMDDERDDLVDRSMFPTMSTICIVESIYAAESYSVCVVRSLSTGTSEGGVCQHVIERFMKRFGLNDRENSFTAT